MINIDTTYDSKITENKRFEQPEPYFSKHEVNIDYLKNLGTDFETLVVIGNGGSITSLRALEYAFHDVHDKRLELVSTMEPDYLHRLEKTLDLEKTVVMPISKSGTTTGVIESTLYFLNKGYEIRPLTSERGTLREIALKKNLECIRHPDIGGRFTGLSETTLAPASMLGLDIEQIFEGGRKMHQELAPPGHNKASKLAEVLYSLEKQGFQEVVTPFYSTRLFGFYPLLIQLMHESVCKNEEGQTYYGDLGPEIQHHTNQRIFGGKKNVVPLFFETSYESAKIKVPPELESLELRGRKLGDFDDFEYRDSLNAELEGIREALKSENRPFINIKVDHGYRDIGAFMAFLQYLAVYSAWIRNVNAFNQPDVEKSKKRGFEERFK